MSHKEISELDHVVEPLSNGGMVFVLDTGAVIDQEAEAMVQALHSRSTGGITSHLEVLEKKGAEKFMSSFYVGYGHKSIGDCGTVTLFIEGVSMLAAKAIQDWPLYSGQEASTRYIDFSEQLFINPAGSDEGNRILEDWRSFYLRSMEPTKAYLKELYPRAEDEKEKIYDKAIAARAFDILRGFLPAGASTNLAWHSNLRQCADKIMMLRHHPLAEVREIAEKSEVALQKAFPSSFGHKRYEGTEGYNEYVMQEDYYYTESKEDAVDFDIHFDLDTNLLESYRSVMEKRPAKTELPKHIAECGIVQARFLLDFGSYRDIQRHRAVTQRMPLVTMEHGFAQWYLDSLPEAVRTDAEAVLSAQEEAIQALGLSPEETQYYVAMGYNLPNRVTGDLGALTYLVELRATRFVHPTLRMRAEQMGTVLQEELASYGYVLHLDPDPGRFDVKRGEHDIVVQE